MLQISGLTRARIHGADQKKSGLLGRDLVRFKRSHLLDVICRFPPILFVSVFQGLLAVAIIMIDSSKKTTIISGVSYFTDLMLLKDA